VADATKDQQLQQVLAEMVVLVAAVLVKTVTIHHNQVVLQEEVSAETLLVFKEQLVLQG
jgi:hypothetical protein